MNSPPTTNVKPAVDKISLAASISASSLIDKEDEDEIKRYSTDKDGLFTRIAVFEGDYVSFAKELENGKLIDDENNITSGIWKNGKTRMMDKTRMISSTDIISIILAILILWFEYFEIKYSFNFYLSI